MLRATVGIDKSRLIWSIVWRNLLDSSSGTLCLRGLNPKVQAVRELLIIFPSFIISLLVSGVLVLSFNRQLISFLPIWALIIWAVVVIPAMVGFGIFLGLGLIFLIDFFTLPIQAHFSTAIAPVTVKSIQMGKVRHVLNLFVDKELVPVKLEGKDLVLTVLATRRGLRNTLQPITARATLKAE